MGCTTSVEQRERLATALPPWCTLDEVKLTDNDKTRIAESWSRLMDANNPVFITRKATRSSLTPLVMFWDTFYSFLFVLLPEARPMFKRQLSSQGRMLAFVIKSSLASISNEPVFRSSLERLARVHNSKNVTADMCLCVLNFVHSLSLSSIL